MTQTETETTTTEFILQRDGERDLKFTGTLLASASSSSNNAHPSYSGAVGRWTELRLYRTAKGKYVAQSIGYTQWQGEHDRYSAAICATPEEVIAFFGTGWLAKLIYERTEIDASEEVE